MPFGGPFVSQRYAKRRSFVIYLAKKTNRPWQAVNETALHHYLRIPLMSVVVSSEFGGITTTSQSAINFSNFSTSSVRARCARMYRPRESVERFETNWANRLATARSVHERAVACDVVKSGSGFGTQHKADHVDVLLKFAGRHRDTGVLQIRDCLVVDLFCSPWARSKSFCSMPTFMFPTGLRGSQWNGSPATVRSCPSGP